MKALSLHQPWASLWLTTRKVHETRGWSTKHRGPLAVHASKEMGVVCGKLHDIVMREFGPAWGDLPRGALIGVVTILDCIPTALVLATDSDNLVCGDWSSGRFAWERSDFRRFAKPIAYRGRQGLFTVPDEVIS